MKRADVDQLLLNDPLIRAALADRPSLCYAESGSQRVASPTGMHVQSVFKSTYLTGLPIAPWCVWCGCTLDQPLPQRKGAT